MLPVQQLCILKKNGKYAVADNGEEIRNLDRNNAIRIIVENLTN
jgi:hypothetical protein